MKGGGHTDDRGSFPHTVSHGILALIYIGIHLRQRAVVTDGTHQHKGYILLHTAVYDAVINPLLLNKGRNGAVEFYPVDGVDVVVMTVWLAVLGIDVLTQSSV